MEPIGPRITGLERQAEGIKRVVERLASNHSGNQNVTVFKVEGAGGLLATLAVGLVAGVCLGVSVAAVGWVSASFSRQDSMNNWTAQEVTAIRSYITNGKLQPMKPRPMGPEDQEKPK